MRLNQNDAAVLEAADLEMKAKMVYISPTSRLRFQDFMIQLKDRCIYHWAKEYADIFPQSYNSIIARNEAAKYGNPNCKSPDECKNFINGYYSKQ